MCSSIGAIALVSSLIRECPSPYLPCLIAPRYGNHDGDTVHTTNEQTAFLFVQSPIRRPHAYLSSKARIIQMKQEMSNKLSSSLRFIASVVCYAKGLPRQYVRKNLRASLNDMKRFIIFTNVKTKQMKQIAGK